MKSHISAYLIGALAGGSTGWFVGSIISDYLEEKEILEETNNEASRQNNFRTFEEMKNSSAHVKKQTKAREKTNYAEVFNKQNRPDLAKLAEKYNNKNGSSQDDSAATNALGNLQTRDGRKVTLLEGLDIDAAESTDINIISSADFLANANNYEVVEVTLYSDNIITGSDDEIIYEADDILGVSFYTAYGRNGNEKNVVYVQNDSVGALYKISKVAAKYAIDPKADRLTPRKGLKKGMDFEEVNTDDDDENEEDDN